MKRIPLVAILIMASCLWAAGPAVAGGGGHGCQGPMTDDETTEVELRSSCFSPTVVRVERGATVTWTNRERQLHTVTGANETWGDHRELKLGDTASYRFARRGVFPYYCAYHPGMIGSVVVGSGVASGSNGSAEPVTKVRAASGVTEAPAPEGVGSGVHPAAIALTLAGIGLIVWARRRRPRRTD
jgi:plastocyanin